MPVTGTYVRHRSSIWIDAIVVVTIVAAFYGFLNVAREWRGPLRPTVAIDLSPLALPQYVLFSLVRGFSAYLLSLVFTLIYGYIAAYNKRAEKVMIPLLDILQSIPVLGFLPGLVLALVALFPHSNVGLELAAVLMIFTGQVWNMTFSFYNSLRAIPNDLREAGSVYKLKWWERFTKLELPYSAIGLVWNSMMSMAGGWFFLTINEAFVLGNKDFRLPGIGSYMSVAIAEGNVPAMIYAIIAMVLMIILVDQLFWRPIVAWVQKFKFEETEAAENPSSFVLSMLQKSNMLKFTRKKIWHPISSMSIKVIGGAAAIEQRVLALPGKYEKFLKLVLQWLGRVAVTAVVAFGAFKLFSLLSEVRPDEWETIVVRLVLTFLRVSSAVALGTLMMVPLGVAIGMHPKLSRILQPVVQIAASFPAPMVFPLVILFLSKAGISIEVGAIALMILGTQWYILFNVIAGAMAIPHDLQEAARFARLTRPQMWKRLILPGIFPSLVTGWVTAAGGAWNASIVSEYVHFGKQELVATGLGATITTATDSGNFGMLAGSILVMSTTVVMINRFFWKRFYNIAEQKFSLNK